MKWLIRSIKKAVVSLSMSEQFRDNIYAFVDAKHAAVQRQVVILRMTPFHIGVEAVIGGTAFVLIPQTLLRGLLPFAVHLNDALVPELHIRMDKDLQAIRLVLQNEVGTASDDYTRPFFRKLRNDLSEPPRYVLYFHLLCLVA